MNRNKGKSNLKLKICRIKPDPKYDSVIKLYKLKILWQIRQVNHVYKLNLDVILYKVIFSDSLTIHACGDIHEKGNWVGKKPLKKRHDSKFVYKIRSLKINTFMTLQNTSSIILLRIALPIIL